MGGSNWLWKAIAVWGLVAAFVVAGSTQAAVAAPYELDPTLSLTGDCSTSTFDPVPDPSCPYPPPPAGPTLSNCTKSGPTEICSSRFEESRVVVVDSFGNEYIATSGGLLRVFDDEGKYISELPVENVQSIGVDSKGQLYLLESLGPVIRYEPSEYKPEEGKIKYTGTPVTVSTGSGIGASITVDRSNDQLFEARQGEITRRRPATEGNTVVESFQAVGSGPWTADIAVDGQRRRIYVSFCKKNVGAECGVLVLEADGAHAVLDELDGTNTPAGQFQSSSGRLATAVDEETGDFFVADVVAEVVYQFDEEFAYLAQFSFNELQPNTSIQIAVSNGKRSLAKDCKYPTSPAPPPGDACNRHYLFVPAWASNGRVAAYHPSNQGPPEIEGVAAARISGTDAQLQATIFPGGLSTDYVFQITTEEAWETETEKFETATVIPGGTIPAESLAIKVSALVTGLTSGQTYRFRAVANNALGSALEEGQNEAIFATYNDALIAAGDCPNEVLRRGASAFLPDCRAYELVTPADTNGRPPKGSAFLGSMFSTLQASPAGEVVSFKIEGGSLPGSSGVASFDGDRYVSSRSGSGWISQLAGVTGAETTKAAPGGVSPDQSYAFWRSLGEGPLGAVGAIYNEYLYYPDGHSEPIGRGSEGVDLTAPGKLITEDGAHVIFETGGEASTLPVKLEPDAPPSGTEAVYDRTIDPVTGEEDTHTVSLLPGEVTPQAGEDANYLGASADGEGIAFLIGNKLYLRVGNETSYEIGEEVEFAGVSEGGKRIFYVEGGDLLTFNVSSEEVIEFSNTGDVTPVNIATGGSRAYFVSPSVFGGVNPLGEEAQAGEQNLYLSEEGAVSFVATVTDRDVEGEVPSGEVGATDGLGLWTEVAGSQPAKDPSRLNPDGSVLLFQSRAEITGYQESNFSQIYRYDSDAEMLHCISCIPTKTPATGGASLESYTFDTFTPKPFSPYGYVRNLTPDGKRVFFDSTEALVSADTDEVNDVYEWEAQGVGSCKQAEGCAYLISSGQSEVPNYLYAHSINGRDVFFTTGDRLTGWDSSGGAISIYDARIGGGFPEPEEESVCVGDGCRPSIAPLPITPSSNSSPQGQSGNLATQKPGACPKGKRKVKKNGKVRCVKKNQQRKRGKASKRARANRRVGE